MWRGKEKRNDGKAQFRRGKKEINRKDEKSGRRVNERNDAKAKGRRGEKETEGMAS